MGLPMVQGTHGVPLFDSPLRPWCDPKDEAEDLQRGVPCEGSRVKAGL